MDSEIFGWILIVFTILSFTVTIAFSMYKYDEIKYDNFQTTIKDLNNEQKCLHICGFEWHGSSYYDNYKFCVEKCDRISERENVK